MLVSRPCDLRPQCPEAADFHSYEERGDNRRAHAEQSNEREASQGQDDAAYRRACRGPELIAGGQHAVGRRTGVSRQLSRQRPCHRFKHREEHGPGASQEHRGPQRHSDHKGNPDEHTSNEQGERDYADAPHPPRHGATEQAAQDRARQREGERQLVSPARIPYECMRNAARYVKSPNAAV